MKNSELIFICNELINPDMVRHLNIPLEFITFAIADGKMYYHQENNKVFYLPEGINKQWGNMKVYGAVFLVKDYYFYIHLLDSYHVCSKNRLKYNHTKDLHHRESIIVNPISFKSISDLDRLIYNEGGEVEVVSYIGNIEHPKIDKRLNSPSNYRKVNGIYEVGFKKLFEEVT